MKLNDPREVERTAYHEAGHAVAYLDRGRRFRYVTIRPRSPDCMGRVAVRAARVDAFTYALITYAGPTAQGLHEWQTHDDDEGLTRDDYLLGAHLFGGTGDREALSGLSAHVTAAAEAAALGTVERCWDVIEGVAQALLRNGTVSYVEAVQLWELAEMSATTLP